MAPSRSPSIRLTFAFNSLVLLSPYALENHQRNHFFSQNHSQSFPLLFHLQLQLNSAIFSVFNRTCCLYCNVENCMIWIFLTVLSSFATLPGLFLYTVTFVSF